MELMELPRGRKPAVQAVRIDTMQIVTVLHTPHSLLRRFAAQARSVPAPQPAAATAQALTANSAGFVASEDAPPQPSSQLAELRAAQEAAEVGAQQARDEAERTHAEVRHRLPQIESKGAIILLEDSPSRHSRYMAHEPTIAERCGNCTPQTPAC